MIKRTADKEKKKTKKTKAERGRKSQTKELKGELKSAKNEICALQAKVDSLEDAVKELEEDRLRFLAEMDNTRKRAQRRLEEEKRSILAELIRPMLDVADNMERALGAAEDGGSSEALREGVRMVHDQMIDVFSKFGVTPIETSQQLFDYNFHEALGHAPAEGRPENEVVAEVSKGYTLNGRLLRPSKVILAKPVDDSTDGS